MSVIKEMRDLLESATKMSTEQFKDLCHEVQDKISSLTSCLDREVPAESKRLRDAVAELKSAPPCRGRIPSSRS